MDIRSPKFSALTGKAGEHAVAAQLMIQGMNVYWPSVDSGCDLLAENGCRIQVKSGHLRNSPSMRKIYRQPVYTAHFPKHRFVATSDSTIVKQPRKTFVELCDIVVFWGIEQNRFWIIPAKLCDKRQCIVLGPSNKREFASDLADMKELISLGFSTYELAKHYGVDQSSIWNRLQKEEEKFTNFNMYAVRACENAWHNILDFGQPVADKIRALTESVSAPVVEKEGE